MTQHMQKMLDIFIVQFAWSEPTVYITILRYYFTITISLVGYCLKHGNSFSDKINLSRLAKANFRFLRQFGTRFRDAVPHCALETIGASCELSKVDSGSLQSPNPIEKFAKRLVIKSVAQNDENFVLSGAKSNNIGSAQTPCNKQTVMHKANLRVDGQFDQQSFSSSLAVNLFLKSNLSESY